jgi:hypothetical protein
MRNQELPAFVARVGARRDVMLRALSTPLHDRRSSDASSPRWKTKHRAAKRVYGVRAEGLEPYRDDTKL